MKKIFFIILLTFVFIFNTFSYEENIKDNKTIETLSFKINSIIDKKGEKTREIFITKLYKLKTKVKTNERLTYIIAKLLENINTSTVLIDDLVKEIENENINNNMIDSNINNNDSKNSSLLFLEEYISTYNTLIDSNIYWRGWKFYLWCWYFWERWNDLYKTQFQDLYDKANDYNNIFLMELIEHDILRLESFLKDTCWNNAKLEQLKYTENKNNNQIDEASYIKMYIFYNSWYNRLYDYFDDTNKIASNTCNDITDDWNDFTYKRLEFIKDFTKKTNSPKINNYFSNLQDRFRSMVKKECNWMKLK